MCTWVKLSRLTCHLTGFTTTKLATLIGTPKYVKQMFRDCPSIDLYSKRLIPLSIQPDKTQIIHRTPPVNGMFGSKDVMVG